MREPRTTIDGVNLVVGFRPELWSAVAADAAPPDARSFDAPVTGPTGQVMPATQHDIVIWVTGPGYDVVFDVSRAIVATVAAHAALVHEMVGWPYHHDRDLTGFIDGTENPSLIEAMTQALVPEGSPGAGGAILLLQQWEHDVASWEDMPVEAQEAVIGRRKTDSVELDPRPEGSHVARTDQDDRGTIFRRNIAYGSADRARDDLRRVQRQPGDPGRDAGQHGRPERTSRCADDRRPRGHRGVLRDPVSRATRTTRRRSSVGPARLRRARRPREIMGRRASGQACLGDRR